jgi:hypothetical protein
MGLSVSAKLDAAHGRMLLVYACFLQWRVCDRGMDGNGRAKDQTT